MNTKQKQTGKVTGLSILCVILIILLGSGLLASVSMRRASQEKLLTAAAEKLPLSEISIDNTSAAEFILNEFVQDERVTAEQIEKVMEEGTFSGFIADLAKKYDLYLDGSGTFPTLSADDLVGLIEENHALILQETGLEFLGPDKEKLRNNAVPIVDGWNSLDKGITGFAVKSSVSVWQPVVLGILLMAVLVWMIIFYVKGGFRAGSALKVYSIALFVPCLAMLVILVLTDAVGTKKMPFIGDSMPMLYGSFMPIFGIGAAICVLLFCTGLFLCSISEKRAQKAIAAAQAPAEEIPAEASAPEEISAPEETPEPEMKRQFCRNCGQPLVNPDAKFCYKCGNVQEHINPEA